MHQSKPCILTVDDEPQIRKMVEITLASCGFKTIEAQSDNETTRLTASYKPDVTILDFRLPDIDGAEIMQVRQKIEKDPQNPQYIITEAGIGYRFDIPRHISSKKTA